MAFNDNLYIKYIYKNTKVFIERSTISETQFNQMNEKVVVSVEVTVPSIKIKKIEPLKTSKKTRSSIRSNLRQVLNDNVNDNNIETNVVNDKNNDKTPPKTLRPKRKLRSDSIKNDSNEKKTKLEIKPIVEKSVKSNLCKNEEKTNKENKNNDNQVLSRVIGLPNMGNTCYINSVIQVLRITPGFKQFVCLLNQTINSQINCNQLKSSNKQLVSTIHELFVNLGNNVDKSNTSATNESKINDLIECEDFKNRFEFGQQQDCHEFLNWLINELNSYVESINGKQNLKTNYNTRRKTNDCNKSFQNFNGVMVREIMCSECNNSRLLHDPFADIQIPLCVNEEEVADICQLQSFQEIIHRKDYLKDDNKFDCRKCEKKTNASVVNSIQTLPKVLIIFLKKPFEYNQMTTRNVRPLKKLFRIPLTLEYKDNKKVIHYSLYALVIHNGSDVDNGHYYVIIDSGSVKTQNKKKGECSCAVNVLSNSGWIRVNDHKVSKLSNTYLNKLLDDQSIASTPYLAFYQRNN